MNITVNTSLNVITKSVDTIADISREFTDGTRLYEVEEVKDKLSRSIGTKFGPASSWQYNVVRKKTENEPTATFDITIEDDAILMYLPMVVKIAKVLSPLYDMAKSAIKLMRNLQGRSTASATATTRSSSGPSASPRSTPSRACGTATWSSSMSPSWRMTVSAISA